MRFVVLWIIWFVIGCGETSTPPSEAEIKSPTEEITCFDSVLVDGECRSCPPGSFVGTVNDETVESCVPVFCQAMEYVRANECRTCPPGTQSPAGTDSRLDDTECDPIRCARNEFVLDNVCLACPDGFITVDEPSAAGPDTVCVPTSCNPNDILEEGRCNSCGGSIFETFGVSCAEFRNGYLKAPTVGRSFGKSLAVSGDTLAVGAFEKVHLYRLSVNGEWVYESEIRANGLIKTDYLAGDFADSIAISNQTIVVGDIDDVTDATGVNGTFGDTELEGSGAAFVLERRGAEWELRAYLKAPERIASGFGLDVAMDGDTIVVGAPAYDVPSRPRSGAIYIFERSAGLWEYKTQFTPEFPIADGFFGSEVAISGNTIAVGSSKDISSSIGINGPQDSAPFLFNSGAVHIYDRIDGEWQHTNYIKSSHPDSGDDFGRRISLSEDLLAVVAPGDSGLTSPTEDLFEYDNSGAVYVYRRDAGVWSEDAYLKSLDPGRRTLMESVAVLGETVIVGMVGDDSDAVDIDSELDNESAPLSGAVSLFRRDPTSGEWGATFLKATNPDEKDRFGATVGLSGVFAFVGATGEESNATGLNGDESDNSAPFSGAVYIRRIKVD